MRILVAAAALVLMTGCGGATPTPSAVDTPTPIDTPTTVEPPVSVRNDLPSSPPAIRLLLESSSIEAAPASSCWESGSGTSLCVDMVATPLRGLPDVGTRSTLEFEFPLPGARFTAYLTPVGDRSAATTVPADDLGDGRYRLAPDVAPGRYRVMLEGRVEPGGEAPGEFVWTIPG